MFENNLLAGVSGQGGAYSIEDSLRFNNDDSAYLSRTPASAGNRKTWTWSGWIKFGGLSETFPRLFSTGTDANNRTEVLFVTSTNQIRFLSTVGGVSRGVIDTNASLRDASGWYHLVISLSASTTTLSVYINGVQQTLSVTTAIANVDHMINATNAHNIGRYFGSGNHFDGYLAEVNFIDGQALTADDFGQIDATTGEWSPKKYSGTYGTNGFYLPFNGNANDDSGNGNNWTENNLASTDYMIDTPTNNFATWNPLNNIQSTSLISFSEGNLLRSESTATNTGNTSTIAPSSGKWYWESYIATSTNTNNYAAVGRLGSSYLGVSRGGTKVNLTGTASTYGGTGTLIGVAIDLDAGTFDIYENGALDSSLTFTPTGEPFSPAAIDGTTTTTTFALIANFGADSSFAGNKTRQGNTDANGIGDFYYTPPTGYLALCTDNLPAPAIEQPETQFNVVTYTGDGTTPQAITGVGFQPDLVWIKRRDSATDNTVLDSIRGDARLETNNTDAELGGNINVFSSFDSDGFTTGFSSQTGASGGSYVAWCWKAGGTAVTNTDGTITSQVSANVDAGFSIVGYTGTGSPESFGHGLSQRPDIVIIKDRDASVPWNVKHFETMPNDKDYLELESTDAIRTASFSTFVLSTSNDSVIAYGTSGRVSNSGEDHIAYCFHSVEGFSKFGTYAGNSSADGPFVYLGFKPAFVLIKASNSAQNWHILDNTRDPYNPSGRWLRANLSDAEVDYTSTYPHDFLSNGFKLRGYTNSLNASGSTYIYMAFAEHPFNYATGR